MQIRPEIDVRARFNHLAAGIFGLSIQEYLAANQNRLLFGYGIHLTENRYFPLFGDPPKELTEAMNQRFHDSIAGYKVAVQTVFPVAQLNADVLLLSTELNHAKECDFDAILIHELCHLVLDSNSSSLTNLALDEKSRYHGDRLYKKTDIENVVITKHNLEFCNVLAAAAERYASQSASLPTRWEVMNSAMRYDLVSNARH